MENLEPTGYLTRLKVDFPVSQPLLLPSCLIESTHHRFYLFFSSSINHVEYRDGSLKGFPAGFFANAPADSLSSSRAAQRSPSCFAGLCFV